MTLNRRLRYTWNFDFDYLEGGNMNPVLEIYFHGLGKSESIEKRIQEKFEQLHRLEPRILAGYVSIEAPHQHRQRDRLYRVKIKLNVPGGEINVSKQHWHDESHRDVYVAIRDAFRAIRRRLQDHQRLMRGDIKANYKPDRAKVSKIFYEQGYGFLEDDLGNEIYFDANSVIGDFERITPGQTVKYKKEQGEQGSQASTVAV